MAVKIPLKTEVGKVKQFILTDTVPSNNLATGVADATTFLRGDGTWAAAGGGGLTQAQALTLVTFRG